MPATAPAVVGGVLVAPSSAHEVIGLDAHCLMAGHALAAAVV